MSKIFKVTAKNSNVDFYSLSHRKPYQMQEKDYIAQAEYKKAINSKLPKDEKKRCVGFVFGYKYNDKIYACIWDIDDAIKRFRLVLYKDKKGEIKSEPQILSQISKKQIADFIAENRVDYVCDYDTLVQYHGKMRYTAEENGSAFQKYLAYLAHEKAEMTNPIEKGGDLLYGKYEVKFIDIDKSNMSTRA